MALYTIADLHLSTLESTNKSMEVFGSSWQNYMRRIEDSWKRLVTEADTVVIPGDISWALSLDEALSDLKFLDSLPGRKILGKGNHDFWWATMKKHKEFFDKNGITTVSFLFNNAHACDGFIIAGTRGWYNDEDGGAAKTNADFEKLTNREALRLELSLSEAEALREKGEGEEIVVFMHFPPYWNGKASESLIEILKAHSVKRVYYGHIHGNYTVPPTFEYEGISMSIVSADYLKFTPKIVK
ncbi:MAG: metallophosphoesterase [Clostridia bacterium]|nr:metallophosphoesterase [Clostridia bacterium]